MNLLGAEYASFSLQGGRAYNEDSVGLVSKGAHLIAVVADGAGGHGGGDVASALCTQYYSEALEQHHQVFESPDSLVRSIEDLNRLVVESQSHGEEQSDMRSTIAVLSINTHSRLAVWAHAGDSRLYFFRRDELHQRTKDHSLLELWKDQQGDLQSNPDAALPPSRNAIYSALGSLEDFTVSVCEAPLEIQPGDAFLMCTDGLWEYISDVEIQEELGKSTSPKSWLDKLIDISELNVKPNSRRDNLSALAIWITKTDSIQKSRA
jgi:PPM family protein phosphatase